MNIHRSSFVWFALLVSNALLIGHTQEGPRDTASPKTLPLLPPGIVIGDEEAANWNRVILLATPRIASGDTAKLSESVRAAVPKLTLTILATVKRDAAGDGTETYRLAEAGVGYSTAINQKMTTISSESASRLGARLDFYSRQMLGENEKQIANLKLAARTSTLAIFDAPAIMFRDGQHKDFVTRHLFWIDSKTGKLALVIWLLSTDTNGRMLVAEKSLRVVAPGTNEDRKIHIDGRSFFLLIPTERAFALEDLPPGTDVPWSAAAQSLAALTTYNSDELNQFALALNQMLQAK
ncbi:MAG: hypothetical protein SFV81_00320 [Pirellulaceae bacterium]|nr:hypothetical protein [Pirellulaceae bacterium]